MYLYPLALKIEGRRCVVVGGGRVAERKVEALRACGAKVTVVSPEFTSKLEELALQGAIKVVQRTFEASDLDGALLAIAATDDTAVNEAVVVAGKSRPVLVNVADVPLMCDFYVPASVNRGALQITVSTSGASPGFSRRLRRQLQDQFGPEYEIYLQMLARLREELKKRVHGQEERQAILESFLDSPALACLAKGAVAEAERLVEECLAGLPEGVPGE